MKITNLTLLNPVNRIILLLLIFFVSANKANSQGRYITLKVIGPDNQALAGAKVYQNYSIRDGSQEGKGYASDSNGMINLPEETIFKYEWQRQGTILYGLSAGTDRPALVGFVKLNGSDLGREVEIKLKPACRVFGELKSTDLEKLHRDVGWTGIYVMHNYLKTPLTYNGQKKNFEFLLPAGRYTLIAYGERLYTQSEIITVSDEQKELKKIIDLPADRLSYLVGQQAPELQQIKGWLNSKPLQLADLRGKVVLLDFWGTWCGSCVASIPKLIDLNKKYNDKGLVIISIHDDSKETIGELEKEIEKLSKEQWDGKKIPFAVALDGGGMCKIEGTQLSTRGVNAAAYGIQAWPTMILIDKTGKVAGDFYPGRKNELLEKLLAADVDNKP